MASVGDSRKVTTTVLFTCEGDLSDPRFPGRLDNVLGALGGLLGRRPQVRKLEPWNSVRVTLSIPRDAAARLRQLANEGSQQLRALGILSVQVEGDQVISLRLVGNEGNEVVLRTEAASSEPQKVPFKSPNVVCPPDSIVPKVAAGASGSKGFSGPFPFTSMNQAIQSNHREGFGGGNAPPPPPYPGKQPAVTVSSPLLVNLLQNEGKEVSSSSVSAIQKPNSKIIKTDVKPTPQTQTINSKPTTPTVPPVSTPKPNPPPPYPMRDWDPVSQQLLDLTPSLTDLKADDLDHLLPSLERELASSPLDLPEEYTSANPNPKRHLLINPLTGELELQSSSDGETDEPSDVFTGLPSPGALSDEDTNSTIRPDTTDQSDSETRSIHSDGGRPRSLKGKQHPRGRDSPHLKQEKIKLRLKLEKSEPVSPAYKVDVSFVNAQPKKASGSGGGGGEELRVPPLHISLRGRNHVVINSKKKKFNADGMPVKPKVRKTADVFKLDRDAESTKDGQLNNSEVIESSGEKRLKKLKGTYEQSLLVGNHLLDRDTEFVHNMTVYNSHFKEKLKERRGSDSELTKASKKYAENNVRRLSQVESDLEATVPGSTNTGTVSPLPIHKVRKDKVKIKENLKCKKSIKLPTGEIDMAKFEQRLLEETEKGVLRPPHRTTADSVLKTVGNDQTEKAIDLVQTLSETLPLKDKPPEPDRGGGGRLRNDDDDEPAVVVLKSTAIASTTSTTTTTTSATNPTPGGDADKPLGRSPNSGGQGEDSGIESMDALSEKSPNQAVQSPHAADMINDTTTKRKTQVPDMLDIEAQLAKMEGINGAGEDVNENKRNGQAKLDQCCALTSALQDSLSKGTVSLTAHSGSAVKEQLPQVEVTLVPMKSSTKSPSSTDDPLPIRVTPPLYTYSNTEKSRGSDSPVLSDSDNSNSCPSGASAIKGAATSLLEQLLIEIPAPSDAHAQQGGGGDSPSPAARSVRTRASSKLNSPSDQSVEKQQQQQRATAIASKRKRHESDSSSAEDGGRGKKVMRKAEDGGVKVNNHVVNNNVKRNSSKVAEESSDSDEPLIEKVRKNNVSAGSGGGGGVGKAKLKVAATVGVVKAAQVNTRRSVRSNLPPINTRSKGDKVVGQPEADVLRRKTRSAVSEGDGKRRKDVK